VPAAPGGGASAAGEDGPAAAGVAAAGEPGAMGAAAGAGPLARGPAGAGAGSAAQAPRPIKREAAKRRKRECIGPSYPQPADLTTGADVFGVVWNGSAAVGPGPTSRAGSRATTDCRWPKCPWLRRNTERMDSLRIRRHLGDPHGDRDARLRVDVSRRASHLATSTDLRVRSSRASSDRFERREVLFVRITWKPNAKRALSGDPLLALLQRTLTRWGGTRWVVVVTDEPSEPSARKRTATYAGRGQ
jgi:hypothetical protein